MPGTVQAELVTARNDVGKGLIALHQRRKLIGSITALRQGNVRIF